MQVEPLRFRLCVPALELVGIDARLGRPVHALLAPVLEGEPTLRHRDGIREQVWPCCLKPGQGIDLDLKMLGRYHLSNDGGQLRLTAPGLQGMLLRPVLSAYLGERLQWQQGLMQADFWLELPVKGALDVPVGNGFGVRVERGDGWRIPSLVPEVFTPTLR